MMCSKQFVTETEQVLPITMSPCHDLQQHPRTGIKFIKKGRLHSQKVLLKREQEFLENWSSVLQYFSKVVDEAGSSDDDNYERSFLDEHNYSAAPLAVKGFKKDEWEMSLQMYYMLQDQIDYLLPEVDLSTDEDDEVENLAPNDDDPIVILAKFSDEQLMDYGYCEPTTNSVEQDAVEALSSLPDHPLSPSDSSDTYSTDGFDSEAGQSRPVSRISLCLSYDHTDNDCHSHFHSGSSTDMLSQPPSRMSCDGSSYCYETDFHSKESCPIKKSQKNHSASYGHILGVPVGTEWKFRRQCSRRSVHRHLNAGIHSGPEGAFSMVLSSPSVVEDKGVVFKYYGEGGRDSKTEKLVRDQEMTQGNLALTRNHVTGNPVRVVRGFQLQNAYSPYSGYRYDGLYVVTRFEESIMGDGFKVFKFDFVRSSNQPPPPWTNDRIKLPWCCAEAHHNPRASEDECPENEWHVKCRRRQQSSLISDDGVKCPTPTSVANDVAPPKLQLRESCQERLLMYPTPPYLSPGFCINPVTTEIQHRAVVRLERLDKDLVSNSLSIPQERGSIRTVQQSRMPGKGRNNDREALMKRKRRCMRKKLKIEKRERNKEGEMANSCSVSTYTVRRNKFPHKDKYIGNATVKCTSKDLPIELPAKRKRGRPRKTSSLDTCVIKQLSNSRSVGRGKKKQSDDISSVARAHTHTARTGSLSTDSGYIAIELPVKRKRGRPRRTSSLDACVVK